jgi:4-hydroxybenzoate polyprenyltransferase
MRNKGVFRSFYSLIRLDYSRARFSAVGSFAFNDYCDFEVDRSNNRSDRLLDQGLLSRKLALITGLIAFLLVILLSLFFSLPIFFLYSVGLKKVFFVKNILIGYAYVATIFLGSLISDGAIELLIIYFAVMGFIVGLAFEIMLDIGDVE